MSMDERMSSCALWMPLPDSGALEELGGAASMRMNFAMGLTSREPEAGPSSVGANTTSAPHRARGARDRPQVVDLTRNSALVLTGPIAISTSPGLMMVNDFTADSLPTIPSPKFHDNGMI